MNVTIRRATLDEASTLTSIALASKAVWGYDEAFMEQCREELTVTLEYIRSCEVYVAELEEQIAGFYGLIPKKPDGVLDYLYVAPNLLKQGIGRKLWEHLLQTAKSLDLKIISIDAEPNAENFYRAMGAERIGVTPSGSIPGRFIPLLKLTV
ncbi:GNAT family N-acetyltransferase [Alicyclobacillus sp. SO9]|uniref:GNAT family N-acetyltransferase n=1 Tax=Alicyclobacillus sp. SO9 TaxID=2665646 RepID=UPI0018E72130|nr:GNAT family N-acetyltransferase [Alicyclobacillus sp. SO9]QQE78354.1 GNAT family N-acetyltransferase [Alicyclobacillus sp. SO9]